ncbi:DUF4190 domain-containing protein [Kitasatospora sp. NPDC058965]|uniref:DUF4190 domain-containing protein n=1 Tax=Kitasatospora sp. NPDC058965 TaxID=3346682 RepID=UPI0036AB4AE8
MTSDDTTADPWAPPPADAVPAPAAPHGAPQPWYVPGAGQPSGWDPAGPRPAYPGTNKLAVTSLVTGLTCCLAPAALGFGIAALVQLGKRRQRGKGLAVTGVVLGVLGLLAMIGSATALIANSRISLTGKSRSVSQLKVGDCFTQSPLGGQVVVVGCRNLHNAEVSAVVKLTDPEFPGAAAARTEARTLCNEAVFSYIYDLWDRPAGLRAGEYPPTDASQWQRGNGTAVCYLADEARSGRTKALRDDARTLTTDQYTFLTAVRSLDLDARLGGRDWITAMATDLRLTEISLEHDSWSGPRKDEVTAYLAELKAKQPVFQAAADDSSTPVDQLVARLRMQDPVTAEGAARRALGLPDHNGSGIGMPPLPGSPS